MEKKAVTAMTISLIITFCIAIFGIIKVMLIPKIGIINTPVLLAEFSEGIKVQRELAEDKVIWENNLKAIEDSVKNSVNNMTNDYDDASEYEKKLLKRKLKFWNEKYNQYSDAIKDYGMKKELELMAPVIEKANNFIQAWRREHKYDLIIGTGAGGVILALDKKFDITNRVVEDLNDAYAKKIEIEHEESDSSSVDKEAISKHNQSEKENDTIKQ